VTSGAPPPTGTDPLGGRAAVAASPAVEAALAALGRTEDVRFAPSGRRLAVAGFGNGTIAMIDLAVTVGRTGPVVAIEQVTSLGAAGLVQPHGIDWLDEHTLLVADRGGEVLALRLSVDGAGRPERLDPVERSVGAFGELVEPGSLLVDRRGGATAVLVCDNRASTVTSHRIDADARRLDVAPAEVLLRRWLDIPDGIAISPDGTWMAVSNHVPQLVLLYRLDRELGVDAEPDGVLRGVAYPHGLRFTADGGHLVVADAGRPLLHVFRRRGDGWGGVQHPSASVRAMDEAVFEAGRHNPQEGGPKGLDVDPGGRILAVTAECQPLAFFDLPGLLSRAGGDSDPTAMLDYELEVLERTTGSASAARQAEADARAARAAAAAADAEADAARQVLAALRQHAAAAEAAAHAARAELDALRRTKTFRLAGPLRRAYRLVSRRG